MSVIVSGERRQQGECAARVVDDCGPEETRWGHYGRVIMLEQCEINGPGKYTVLLQWTRRLGVELRARPKQDLPVTTVPPGLGLGRSSKLQRPSESRSC